MSNREPLHFIQTDVNFHIYRFSSHIEKYIDDPALLFVSADVREVLPELYGCEERVQSMLDGKCDPCLLPVIAKKEYFVSIETIVDSRGYMFLLRDETKQIKVEQSLLQSRNKNALLNQKLKKLNQQLQTRVDEAVEAARHSDMLLINQSRFAIMGEMLANIAHQWRQPLNAMGLMLYALKDSWEFEEVDNAYIDTFYHKTSQLVHNMSETIDDFRYFFQPEHEEKYFDVHEAIQYTVEFVKEIFNDKNIAIFYTPGARYMIKGYRNQLIQVFLNIFGNAKDAVHAANGPEKWIRINTEKDGEYIQISIQDSGGGINESLLSNIFDPYFTTKGDNGTGLGLSISRSILEHSFSGSIQASNQKAGALFLIKIPLQENQNDHSTEEDGEGNART